MHSGNSRSTIVSPENNHSQTLEDKPMKTSSIVSTVDAIYGTNESDRILRR